jgi:hypothetical protein
MGTSLCACNSWTNANTPHGMLAIAYGFCILASAATALLAVALYLPVDRFLGNTSRMAWLAIAIAVVYLIVDAAQYCDRVDGAGSRQPVCHRR